MNIKRTQIYNGGSVLKRARSLFIAFLLVNACFAAQLPKQATPLDIGDALPDDIVLANAFNYPGGKMHLKDFRGKLLLIDFWSTWCSSCIEGFSKLHELQNKFSSQIQIVLVNTQQSDTEQKVRTFFERRRQRTGTAVTLPYVLQDSLLPAYFPHQTIPHYAWIDESGKVIAITYAEEVTEQNIRRILKGENITLRRKKELLDFDTQKPLFVEGNGGEVITPIYRSMITGYIEGIGSLTGVRRDKEEYLTGYYSYNKFLLPLLREAFRDIMIYPDNRIVVEGSASILRQIKQSTTAANKEMYCYELVMPPGTMQQALAAMQNDLTKTFNLTVCNEKRKVKALILSASENIALAYTKGGIAEAVFEKDRVHKYLRNYPVAEMLWLANNAFTIPVIDETGVSQNIDMDLPEDMASEEQWIKALEKTGIKATIAEREMEMTVITNQ